MNSIKTKPQTLDQISSLAEIMAKHLQETDVVTLSGDLGAGKTTLITNIAQNLGLPKNVQVSSPTYVLHHRYPGTIVIHHLDLYRLEKNSEVLSLGFEEFLGLEGITFIEWFEKFPELWNGARIQIEIKIQDLDHRTYHFSCPENCRPRWLDMFKEIEMLK